MGLKYNVAILLDMLIIMVFIKGLQD